MTDTVENLILDLIEWLGRRERTYQETMDAWRTTCPRLPVWEDANDRGLVEMVAANGRSVVRVTPVGLALLGERRPYSFEEQHRQGGKESRSANAVNCRSGGHIHRLRVSFLYFSSEGNSVNGPIYESSAGDLYSVISAQSGTAA
jgi:hypothetical protein